MCPWGGLLLQNGDPVVYEIIQTIIKPIMLRRTKQTKDRNGKNIIALPDKFSNIEFVELSEQERMMYDEIYNKNKQEFEGYLAQGIALTKYMQVFEMLTRLRQFCDHPCLINTRSDFSNISKLESTLRKFVQKRNEAASLPEDNNNPFYEVRVDDQGNEIT